jgi:isochorismate hydrolase
MFTLGYPLQRNKAANRKTKMDKSDSSARALIKAEDCILLIVDVQKKLVAAIPESVKYIDKIVKLIKLFKIMDLPVMITEQQNLGETVTEIRQELQGVKPLSKITFSCFGTKEFKKNLAQYNKKVLLIAGIEAHICVAQTALQAIPRYRVQVIGDAVASRALQNCELALERLRQNGITITSTEMLMYELLEKAGTDHFRAALPLVK